jgi:hypothetical protein
MEFSSNSIENEHANNVEVFKDFYNCILPPVLSYLLMVWKYRKALVDWR